MTGEFNGPIPSVPPIPNITPWVLPSQPFDALINAVGARFMWKKAHDCPCAEAGGPNGPGNPDPACQTCQGKGVYWDPSIGPWMGLLTFMHMAPSPDEPGQVMNTSFGKIVRGEPTMTIPFSASGYIAGTQTMVPAGTIWEQVSENDAFVEIDASVRFSANLKVGGVEAVPFQQGLSIAATGAVSVYDMVNHVCETVVGYTVSGATVLLPDSYPEDTAYTVEFYANPIYVAFRRAGGLPHVRPFGGGQVSLPKRFRLQPLDLWLRARSPTSNTPESIGT